MSPNDPELPMQDLPRMVPDREDIARRKKKIPEPRMPKTPAVEETRSGTSIWVVLCLVFIVGAVGFLFWQNMQLSDKLAKSSLDLKLSDARIQVLEGQLSATGENLVVNEENIKAQFGIQMSEIRKLWDVTNKRNKTWIQDNQTAVTSLKQQLELSKASLTKTDQRVSAEIKKNDGLRTDLESLSLQSSESSASLKSQLATINLIQSRLDEVSLSQSLMSDQLRSQNIERVEQEIVDLKSEITSLSMSLSSRQDEMDQDIASINTHRLQVNQRLSSLQEQLMVIENRLITEQP